MSKLPWSQFRSRRACVRGHNGLKNRLSDQIDERRRSSLHSLPLLRASLSLSLSLSLSPCLRLFASALFAFCLISFLGGILCGPCRSEHSGGVHAAWKTTLATPASFEDPLAKRIELPRCSRFVLKEKFLSWSHCQLGDKGTAHTPSWHKKTSWNERAKHHQSFCSCAWRVHSAKCFFSFFFFSLSLLNA